MLIGSKSVLKNALTYAAKDWPVISLHNPINGSCSCRNQECDSPSNPPKEPLYDSVPCRDKPANYHYDHGLPENWIEDLTNDGPPFLSSVGDLLDAANLVVRAERTPIVRVYVDPLENGLDSLGVGR